MNTYITNEISIIFNNIINCIKNPELDNNGKIIQCIFMPISIQGVGKTTLYNRISKSIYNDKIGVSSADSYMPKKFNYLLLKDCHKKCIEDTIKIIKSGKHCFVDNLNGLAHFRTIYNIISKQYNVRLIPYVICGDKWLTCDEKDIDKNFLKTIIKRCDDRYKLSGKYIDEPIIMATINSIRINYNKYGNNINEWLDSFPNPQYIPGFNIINSHYILQNNIIDKIVDNYIILFNHNSISKCNIKSNITCDDSILDKILFNKNENILNKKIQIGFENPINIIENNEMNSEIEIKIKKFNLVGFKNPTPKGIGIYLDNDEYIVFIMLDWEWGNKLRNAIGLKKKEFHITLFWSCNYDINNGIGLNNN